MVIVVLLALAGPTLLSGCAPSAATTPQTASFPTVVVSRPEKAQVQDFLEFTGRTEAYQRVEIRSRISGYLQAIKFRDGQLVKAGDPLFEIDPRPFSAVRDRAQASLAQAQARHKLAAAQFERVQRLHQASATSTDDVDRARGELETAQAAILLSQADLRSAELELSFTTIRAPVTGKASDRRIDIGNYVAGGGGQTAPMTTIVVQTPMRFVTDVPERDFSKMRQASAVPIQVQLDVEGVKSSQSGVIDFIDNEFAARSGTVRLRASISEPTQAIMPGSFAKVRIPVGRTEEQLLVPDAAVVSDQTRKMVMVVDAAGKVVPKKVELGRLVGKNRVVSAGLSPDDQVIVSGGQRVRPGDQVQVAPAQAGS